MSPAVTFDEVTGEWVTLQPFSYADVHIPQGFRCDLSSVPRGLWFLVAPFELSIAAPLVHDWLYRHGGHVEGRTYTRAECDKLFLEIMSEEQVPTWRRRAAYTAVRLFGGGAFKKD